MLRTIVLLTTLSLFAISCELVDLLGDQHISQIDLNTFKYGAGVNPTGDPIGGGSGYRDIIRQGDYTVSDGGELLLALHVAQPGEVIVVASGANINLTGYSEVDIPPNVTLAGDRGYQGSQGPLIFVTYVEENNFLFRPRSGSRITGLRIRGPEANFPDINYDNAPATKSRTMRINGSEGIEVDNCEISNFQRGGIEIQDDGRDVHIHHNYFHNIHAYPVIVASRAKLPVLIEANRIEWIWHATAGSGHPGSGYEARYNMIIRKPVPDSWQPYDGSWAIDMHSDDDVDQSRGHQIAASLIHVHYNTFINDAHSDPSTAISLDTKIRGVPRILAEFNNNCFLNADPAQAVVHFGGNVWVYNNLYGEDSTLIMVAQESTPQILFNSPPPPAVEIPKMTGDNLEVDIEVNVVKQLSVSHVSITLNEVEIYSGDKVPAPGEVTIDLSALDSNLPYQELKVTAIDNRGVTGEHITVFDVE